MLKNSTKWLKIYDFEPKIMFLHVNSYYNKMRWPGNVFCYHCLAIWYPKIKNSSQFMTKKC